MAEKEIHNALELSIKRECREGKRGYADCVQAKLSLPRAIASAPIAKLVGYNYRVAPKLGFTCHRRHRQTIRLPP